MQVKQLLQKRQKKRKRRLTYKEKSSPKIFLTLNQKRSRQSFRRLEMSKAFCLIVLKEEQLLPILTIPWLLMPYFN